MIELSSFNHQRAWPRICDHPPTTHPRSVSYSHNMRPPSRPCQRSAGCRLETNGNELAVSGSPGSSQKSPPSPIDLAKDPINTFSLSAASRTSTFAIAGSQARHVEHDPCFQPVLVNRASPFSRHLIVEYCASAPSHTRPYHKDGRHAVTLRHLLLPCSPIRAGQCLGILRPSPGELLRSYWGPCSLTGSHFHVGSRRGQDNHHEACGIVLKRHTCRTSHQPRIRVPRTAAHTASTTPRNSETVQ
jgi:hypothetical protein